MELVKDDIRRFIPYSGQLDIRTTKYFHDLVEHLKIMEPGFPLK
jgi:hypothetical protein